MFLHFISLIKSTFVCFPLTLEVSVFCAGGEPSFISNTDTFPKQVSLVQYSDNAKTEFRLNAYRDKGVAMAALYHIRYQGGNTKTGSITRHRHRETLIQLFFWHRFPLLSRNGAQTHLWEGFLCGKWNEEKRSEGGRRHHWRTLSGRGEEERCQAAARR